MPTPHDLRTLYLLGFSWDRAAATLGRMIVPGSGVHPEAATALGAAADSCRQLREILLACPDAPVARAFLSATRNRFTPHSLADILENLASTLARVQDSPPEVALLSRSSLARIGEFLSDAGQAILRDVARQSTSKLAS